MPESVFESIDPEINALVPGSETCKYFTLNEYRLFFTKFSNRKF